MRKKRAYLVGIKGIAMTSLAVYLKQKGYQVIGSDVNDFFPSDIVLRQQKIKVIEGFSSKNINNNYDLMVVTGAHGGMTNTEAVMGKKNGISTYMHGEAVGYFMHGKFGISVSGCHGKTTTSSMIALLLTSGGFDPSYLIGTSEINGLGPAGHYGNGSYFVAEADEYMTCPKTDSKPRFLWQNPKVLVITNIEYDHPDAFPNIDSVKNAFLRFAEKVPDDGLIVTCIDNNNIKDIIPRVKKKIITYGFSPQSDFQIKSYYFGEGVSFMRIQNHELDLGEYMLRIPGKHNLLNALAASLVVNQIGIDWEKIREYLKLYTGCKRRFEKIYEHGNINLYDDYAHHPSEIQATISAARTWFSTKRIIVIFQPHTFSRTKALFSEFAKSFSGADLAIVADIYPSKREKFDPTISSNQLVLEINKHKDNAVYKSDKKAVLAYLSSCIQDNDLIFTMGAGDIYTWQEDLMELLKKRSI